MRLLLIEDDELLGEGLHDFLRAEGHAVAWAHRLSDTEPHRNKPFAAWLVGWQLPNGCGLDGLRAQRRRGDSTPALMLTARDRLAGRLARRVSQERAFAAHAAHTLRTPLAGIDAQRAAAVREAPAALQARPQRVRAAGGRPGGPRPRRYAAPGRCAAVPLCRGALLRCCACRLLEVTNLQTAHHRVDDDDDA